MLSWNASHRHGATSSELDIRSPNHTDLSGVEGCAISSSNANAADWMTRYQVKKRSGMPRPVRRVVSPVEKMHSATAMR